MQPFTLPQLDAIRAVAAGKMETLSPKRSLLNPWTRECAIRAWNFHDDILMAANAVEDGLPYATDELDALVCDSMDYNRAIEAATVHAVAEGKAA